MESLAGEVVLSGLQRKKNLLDEYLQTRFKESSCFNGSTNNLEWDGEGRRTLEQGGGGGYPLAFSSLMLRDPEVLRIPGKGSDLHYFVQAGEDLSDVVDEVNQRGAPHIIHVQGSHTFSRPVTLYGHILQGAFSGDGYPVDESLDLAFADEWRWVPCGQGYHCPERVPQPENGLPGKALGMAVVNGAPFRNGNDDEQPEGVTVTLEEGAWFYGVILNNKRLSVRSRVTGNNDRPFQQVYVGFPDPAEEMEAGEGINAFEPIVCAGDRKEGSSESGSSVREASQSTHGQQIHSPPSIASQQHTGLSTGTGGGGGGDDPNDPRRPTNYGRTNMPLSPVDTALEMNPNSNNPSMITAVIDKIARGEDVSPRISMRYEMLRLCTLRSYPEANKPYITRLAQAGFYYAKSGDEVVCYVCAKRVSGWLETDDPIQVHRVLTPNCRFLVDNSNVNVPIVKDSDYLRSNLNNQPDREREARVRAQSSQRTRERGQAEQQVPGTGPSAQPGQNPSQSGAQGEGISSRPKRPEYASERLRLDSFDSVRIAVPISSLAEAGFYYGGTGDCTRCFQCGIGLRDWNEGDNPWLEHARWSKKCDFVRNKKGLEFVNLVHLALQYAEQENMQPDENHRVPLNAQEDQGLSILMNSNAGQVALEMGYQPEAIKRVLRQLIQNQSITETGGRLNAALLVERLMENQERSENERSENERSENERSENERSENERSENERSENERSENERSENERSENERSENERSENEERAPQGTSSNGEGLHARAHEETGAATAPVENPPSSGTHAAAAAPVVPASGAVSSNESKSMTEKEYRREQKRLKKENERLKQEALCGECKKKGVCIVFLPCGHLVTCEECARDVEYCPVLNCGKYIRGTVKTYQ